MAFHPGGDGRVGFQEIRHPPELVIILRLDIGLVAVEIDEHRHGHPGRSHGKPGHVGHAGDDCIGPPVLALSVLGAVVGDGTAVAIAYGRQAGRIDVQGARQVGHHALRTGTGQIQVVFRVPDIIGVALDHRRRGRVFGHVGPQHRQLLQILTLDRVLVDVELEV